MDALHKLMSCCVQDELLWAATWLYKASRKSAYLKYITDEGVPANVAEFNWDLKYAGAQIVLSEVNLSLCLFNHMHMIHIHMAYDSYYILGQISDC